MSANRPLRIAAVGTGYFSRFHYDAWRRLDVSVVGICSLSRQDAQANADRFPGCRAFEDFEDMLDEVHPDLVDIIVPPHEHVRFISAAAKRGIAILCQKPFTPSLEDAERAAGIAREAGVPLAVHENFRFQPWHLKVRELIDKGALGAPYQISFRMRPGDGRGREAYLNRQPYFQKMERFLIHETAIHVIDVFRYLFGEITSVTAELARLNPHIAGEDAGLVLFGFASGARGLFDGNRLSDHVAEDRRLTIGDMLVEGTNGTIRLNGDGDLFFREFGDNEEHRIDNDWAKRGFAGDSVFRLQQHIVNCLTTGDRIPNTAEDYLANLRIEDAVYRSHDIGARVKLPLEPQKSAGIET